MDSVDLEMIPSEYSYLEFRNNHKTVTQPAPPKKGAAKDKTYLQVDEATDSLIRYLAETHSQTSIARILNEKGLLHSNGQRWQQFQVCRYFKKHGIRAVHRWKGHR